MLFRKRKPISGPVQPHIEVFVRHCFASDASAHKKRPAGFSREACHRNLLATADERVRFTYLLDNPEHVVMIGNRAMFAGVPLPAASPFRRG
jgi:hypothetical protein